MSAPVLSWPFIARARTLAHPWSRTPVHSRQSLRTTHHGHEALLTAVHTSLALRANPFPEVTDPFCRLPLPTLFYQLEAFHLGDQMRLSVRPRVRISVWLEWDVSRIVRRAPDTPWQKPACSSGASTLSPSKSIPGCRCWLPLTS